jgi:putative transcriptional regulator
LNFLHPYDFLPDCHRITDGVYQGGDLDALKEHLITGVADAEKMRFFLGYSGWNKKQLNTEIAQKSWVIVPDPNPKWLLQLPETKLQMWQNILHQIGGEHRQLSHFPIHPSMN